MRIGIDLGGTKIEAIALDDGGETLLRRRIDAPQGDYAETVAAISNLVNEVESNLERRGSVGIGIPGAISPGTGLVKNANSTWLIGNPLDDDLAAALDRPVRLANDANCFALSEAIDGAAQGNHAVFGVILGTGVGGGIVIDGQVLGGHQAIAGEWGHNPLPWPSESERPGPACYCGQSGCVETFRNGAGLARGFDPEGQVGAQAVANLARKGDARAIEAIALYCDRLARALAGIINILDPDCIVLGGGLSNIELLYEAIPRLWNNYVFSNCCETKLVQNIHGDSSGVRGAAWLWPA